MNSHSTSGHLSSPPHSPQGEGYLSTSHAGPVRGRSRARRNLNGAFNRVAAAEHPGRQQYVLNPTESPGTSMMTFEQLASRRALAMPLEKNARPANSCRWEYGRLTDRELVQTIGGGVKRITTRHIENNKENHATFRDDSVVTHLENVNKRLRGRMNTLSLPLSVPVMARKDVCIKSVGSLISMAKVKTDKRVFSCLSNCTNQSFGRLVEQLKRESFPHDMRRM